MKPNAQRQSEFLAKRRGQGYKQFSVLLDPETVGRLALICAEFNTSRVVVITQALICLDQELTLALGRRTMQNPPEPNHSQPLRLPTGSDRLPE